MAWIKFEKDLLSDPRLLRMAKSLAEAWCLVDAASFADNAEPMSVCNDLPLPSVTLVCGSLVRLWAIADTHIREDDVLPLGPEEIEAILEIPGFCALMPEDWLEPIDAKSVKLPNFHLHNGTVAKTRALTQRRVADHRESKRNASPLLDQTRPEKTKPVTTTPLPPLKGGNGKWWESEEATLLEAKARGLTTNPGESWFDFRARIRNAPRSA